MSLPACLVGLTGQTGLGDFYLGISSDLFCSLIGGGSPGPTMKTSRPLSEWDSGDGL
jgi:hypothetical protein